MVQVRSCVRKQPKTEPLEPTVVALDEVIKRFDDHKQALSRDDIVSLWLVSDGRTCRAWRIILHTGQVIQFDIWNRKTGSEDDDGWCTHAQGKRSPP